MTTARKLAGLGGALAACATLLGPIARADVMTDAGMSGDQIKTGIVQSVYVGRPFLPSTLRRLSTGARADFVKAAGALAIAYYKTGDFQQRYQAMRDAQAPKLVPLTAEEMQRRNAAATADDAKSQAEQKNMVANFEKQRGDFKKAGMTDAQINQILAQLKAGQAQLADMRSKGQIPNGPVLMTEAQRKAENDMREQQYRATLAQYDKEHPRDPNAFLRARLDAFLKLSASVDFNAQVEKGKFLKAEYERQSADWKLCYRAGKPAVDAARTVAQEWMKAL